MKTSLAQRCTALETRQADLERRIAELEKPLRDTWPWNPSAPLFPQGTADRCHVCGIAWKDADGYCCNLTNCPRGQVTCDMTRTPDLHSSHVIAETPKHLIGTTVGVGDGWGVPAI